ncbi:hypothetical protein [Streptomyces sp. NPDC018833]|uniref:hypothetical protein n=1 Tax=Streptomyces sp. NPDC018833 TaxID=3365053 RepID=UPI0037AA8A59
MLRWRCRLHPHLRGGRDGCLHPWNGRHLSPLSISQQIGGAVGLAALVAVASHGIGYGAVPGPTLNDIVDRLRLVGVLEGAVAVLGGLVALLLRNRTQYVSPATVTDGASGDTSTDEVAVATS